MMKNCLNTCAVGVFATVLIAPVWGFEVLEVNTEAGVDPSPFTPVVHVEFTADVINEDFNELPISNVMVDWGGAGGIQPSVTVAMPIGCFVRNRGFHVDDFRSCGVEMTADFGTRTIPLAITDFEASVVPRSNGTHTYIMMLKVAPPDGTAPTIIGILGGSAVQIAIGAATEIVELFSVEAKGIAPPDDR